MERWSASGIGPRDVYRAGWTKDVGDLQYIAELYKDPSEDPSSWWYAAVAGKIATKMKAKMQGTTTKIFLTLIASKMLAKAGEKTSKA